MVHNVHMPSLGANMEKGKIVKWFAQTGASVKQGDVLASIETDKAAYDILAPGTGILKIIQSVGTEVPVGGVMGVIAATAEEYERVGKDSGPAASPALEAGMAPGGAPASAAPLPPESSAVKISAIARKIAAEHGVDVRKIQGSGPGGRITKEDVEKAMGPASPPPPISAPAAKTESSIPGEPKVKSVEPLTGKKKVMARRLQESMQVMAQMTNWEFVDMTQLIELKRSGSIGPDADGGVTFSDIFVKFTALALQEYPLLNSTLQDDRIITYEDINVGLAVAMGEGVDDLVVPVIRRVQEKSIREISRELRALIRKARENVLSLDDLRGGTISITNIGAFGANPGTPIIQLPQSAVVGFGAIEKKAVVVDDQIVIRPITLLAVSVDHRFITGAISARFRKRLKDLLEHPAPVVLDLK